MKTIMIFVLVVMFSNSAVASLLAPEKDVRNGRYELEVLPPMGFWGCEECQNPYMGGVKGPSKAQIENAKEHLNIIYEDANSEGGKANSVKGG